MMYILQWTKSIQTAETISVPLLPAWGDQRARLSDLGPFVRAMTQGVMWTICYVYTVKYIEVSSKDSPCWKIILR